MLSRSFKRRQGLVSDGSPAFYCDSPRDPTGTLRLRQAFKARAEMKWSAMRKLTSEAIVQQNMLGLGSSSLMNLTAAFLGQSLGLGGPTDSKVKAFQNWFDNTLNRTVLEGAGGWLEPMTTKAYDQAIVVAQRLTKSALIPEDRDTKIGLLRALAYAELQGIVEAVSQRAVRDVAHGLMRGLRPVQIFRNVADAIAKVGAVRTRALVDVMVVKTYSQATLDQFKRAGIKRVGLVPEVIPNNLRKKTRVRDGDWNEEDHPREPNGEFGEGGGGGDKIEAKGSGKFLEGSKGQLEVASKDTERAMRAAIGKAGYTNKDVEKAPLEVVRVSEMYATQSDTDKKTISEYLKKEQSGAAVDRPEGYKIGGKVLVTEGHHRIAAKIQNGAKSVKMHVLKLDAAVRDDNPNHDPITGEFTSAAGGGTETLEMAKTMREAKEKAERKVRAMQLGEAFREPFGKHDIPEHLRKDAKIKKVPRVIVEPDLVNVLTAGDDDVCQVCEDISDDGPYDIDEAYDLIPAHPHCRCAFVPVFDLRFAIGNLLGGDHAIDDEWNEEDHPRAENGEFGEGGGSKEPAEPLNQQDIDRLEADYSKLDKKDSAFINNAAETWLGPGHADINGALRNGDEMAWASGKYQQEVRGMDRMLDKAGHNLDRDTTMYRGVEKFREWKVGDKFEDRGFSPMTYHERNANTFAGGKDGHLMHIRVPKGTRVVSPTTKSGEGAEPELLTRRGSTYRVTKVDGRNIHVERSGP